MVNKIMEEQIMSHKFHEFLYGYNTEERTKFLRTIEEHYPIVYGKNAPMAIRLASVGIQEQVGDKESISEEKSLLLGITSREYLKNSIACHIVSRIVTNNEVMGQVENEMLAFFNSYKFGRKAKVSTVNNYIKELMETLDICRENYWRILHDGVSHPQMFDFPSDFYNIEWFGKKIKKILNNNDQFNIIVDNSAPIALTLNSAKAIMSVVNSRCAGTICMKIATDFEEWPTYYDLNGYFVENIHDYSIKELDDSYQKTLDRKIRCFRENN